MLSFNAILGPGSAASLRGSQAANSTLTEWPESTIICNKGDGQTKLKGLNKGELSHWLEKYRLGELWISGELGEIAGESRGLC